MAASSLCSKIRSVFFSLLFAIASFINCDRTCGGFPVAFAEPAVSTIIPRGTIIRSGSYSGNNSATICRILGTVDSDCDVGGVGDSNHHVVNESGECNHASGKSSSLSLCLRPLNARSALYIRTLHLHQDSEEENKGDVDEEKNFMYSDTDVCWQSFRDTETKTAQHEPTDSSKPMNNSAITLVAYLPSTFPLNSNSESEKIELQSLALKVDLLFATTKVQNNEILLPQSIAELLREGSSTPDSSTRLEDDLTTSLPRVVDLTGRWRPATTVSTQDLTDYDEFLKACCSDKLSYWTRQLLTSSSVVSRQEFVAKQLDEGRILEFVDIHPLSSSVWNRTIVTNRSPENDGKTDKTDDNNRSFVNRLKDPQGNTVLVEAFWQENGTVHTSLLRKDADGNNGDGSVNEEGWVQTRRYLFSGTNNLEPPKDQEDEKRVMMVETTYYSTLFPSDAKELLNARSPSKSYNDYVQQGEDKVTRMVWQWEEVTEASTS